MPRFGQFIRRNVDYEEQLSDTSDSKSTTSSVHSEGSSGTISISNWSDSLSTWSVFGAKKLSKSTQFVIKTGIEAVYRRDFDLVRQILAGFVHEKELVEVKICFLVFWFNWVDREQLTDYQGEEYHFKKMDKSAQCIHRDSWKSNPSGTVYVTVLRACVALDYILDLTEKSELSHRINGLAEQIKQTISKNGEANGIPRLRSLHACLDIIVAVMNFRENKETKEWIVEIIKSNVNRVSQIAMFANFWSVIKEAIDKEEVWNEIKPLVRVETESVFERGKQLVEEGKEEEAAELLINEIELWQAAENERSDWQHFCECTKSKKFLNYFKALLDEPMTDYFDMVILNVAEQLGIELDHQPTNESDEQLMKALTESLDNIVAYDNELHNLSN